MYKHNSRLLQQHDRVFDSKSSHSGGRNTIYSGCGKKIWIMSRARTSGGRQTTGGPRYPSSNSHVWSWCTSVFWWPVWRRYV